MEPDGTARPGATAGHARGGGGSPGAALVAFENYNGTGYRSRKVPSPYLWSFGNHYPRGKFSSDGRYDPNLVSQQVGAATLIHHLEAQGWIEPLATG